MKKFWILLVILSLLLPIEGIAAQKFSRFSKNAIGPLNVMELLFPKMGLPGKK